MTLRIYSEEKCEKRLEAPTIEDVLSTIDEKYHSLVMRDGYRNQLDLTKDNTTVTLTTKSGEFRTRENLDSTDVKNLFKLFFEENIDKLKAMEWDYGHYFNL